MTDIEKTPLELTEQVIKDIEWFINGHGVCISIASAYSNAKKLHKLLSTNKSKESSNEVIKE